MMSFQRNGDTRIRFALRCLLPRSITHWICSAVLEGATAVLLCFAIPISLLLAFSALGMVFSNNSELIGAWLGWAILYCLFISMFAFPVATIVGGVTRLADRVVARRLRPEGKQQSLVQLLMCKLIYGLAGGIGGIWFGLCVWMALGGGQWIPTVSGLAGAVAVGFLEGRGHSIAQGTPPVETRESRTARSES